jgi:hypothetical protein
MDRSTFESESGNSHGQEGGGTFGFTISGSSVTAMSAVNGTKSHALKIPANASFVASVVKGVVSVTETITQPKSTETIVYGAESATSTAFHIVSDTIVVSAPTTTSANGSTVGFEFSSTNGTITDVQRTSTYKGVSRSSDAGPSGAVFVKNADGSVTESFVHGNAIETIKFVKPTGSTLYAIGASTTTYIPLGASKTVLNVEPEDRLDITLRGNSVTGVQSVAPNGVKTTLNLPTGVVFQEVTAGDPSLIQEIVTRNGHSSYELFLKSAATGLYTEIAHGTGVTVDLVGIQAQLQQLPAGLLANI